MQSVIVKQGDTMVNVLKTAGAEAWQAQSISEVFASMPGRAEAEGRPGSPA